MEPISKVNLERITNGIYAFTMTLLVRNIQSPQPDAILSEAAIDTYVGATILSIVDFIGAFILLGMFWLFYFQVFHRIRSVDFRFVHLHLLSLMLVVFVPFTQTFSDERVGIPVSAVLFQFNYMALAAVLVIQWYYAANNPSLIAPGMSRAEVLFLQKKFLVPLGVSMIGIILILADLPYDDVLYLLPFVILGIFFRNPPRRTETEGKKPGFARDDADEPALVVREEEVPDKNE